MVGEEKEEVESGGGIHALITKLRQILFPVTSQHYSTPHPSPLSPLYSSSFPIPSSSFSSLPLSNPFSPFFSSSSPPPPPPPLPPPHHPTPSQQELRSAANPAFCPYLHLWLIPLLLKLLCQAGLVLTVVPVKRPSVSLTVCGGLPVLSFGILYCHIKQQVMTSDSRKKTTMPSVVHFTFILAADYPAVTLHYPKHLWRPASFSLMSCGFSA